MRIHRYSKYNYLICRATFTKQRAFTLVEMLIAMAVTLLMMAAIARSFSFVGERVRDSRASLQLSGDLRDITTRLIDELGRCTVNLEPNLGDKDQAGYFLYYEGPVTDATSSLFRAVLDSKTNELDLPDSRYSDFDDYLAFTVVANPNSWFTGKVPRYLLDERTVEEGGTASTGGAFDPITIRSKYAEIIYFASPEYSPVPLISRNPAYIDVDGNANLDGIAGASENGIPDRLYLHRRVLLIRPDLNRTTGVNAGQLSFKVSGSTRFMQADDWPMANTSVVTVNAVAAAVTGLPNDAWLYGMAAVHQQCDLSLRRVLDANGLPTNRVAANSLEELAKPHNRFAHVRVPPSAIGSSGSNPTSMPILALGNSPTILEALTSGGARIAPIRSDDSSAPGVPVVTPTQWSGFLRPEFVLGSDNIHFDEPADSWGLERIGEDLLANNVVGFDLKIYDPQSVSFTTTNSVVGPNDAGYREAVVDAISNTTSSISRGEVRGGFVDLAYPVLAGGSLRGWQARNVDSLSTSTTGSITSTGNYLTSPLFSGVGSIGTTPSQVYVNSLYRSGKILIESNAIRIFQPTFDTYSSCYERDGFLQNRQTLSDEGVVWRTSTTGAGNGSDGLDGSGIYGAGLASVSGQFGADDLGEHETQPPFINRAESMQIIVRLENPVSRQVRQSSVVHRDLAH